MDELHAVSFLDRHGLKVLAIDESTVHFHDNRWIVFLVSIQQFLDCDCTPVNLFGKTIEHEFQGLSLSFGLLNRLLPLCCLDWWFGAHLCFDAI